MESARKDLTSVVAQAQKELEHLTAEGGAALRSATAQAGARVSGDESGSGSREVSGDTPSSATTEGDANEKAAATPSDGPDAGPSSPGSARTPTAASPAPSASTSTSAPTSTSTTPNAQSDNPIQALLARAQATLPELEKRLQAAAPTRDDLAALRAQADEFSARGEQLLRGAGAYLREAVRVVPPEDGEEEGSETPEVVLDAMGGVVVLPTSMGSGARRKGKGPANANAKAGPGGRLAAVLARLRREPETMARDPAADEDMAVREAYATWLAQEVSARDGGMDAKYWKGRVEAELRDEDGAALGKTRDALGEYHFSKGLSL